MRSRGREVKSLCELSFILSFDRLYNGQDKIDWIMIFIRYIKSPSRAWEFCAMPQARIWIIKASCIKFFFNTVCPLHTSKTLVTHTSVCEFMGQDLGRQARCGRRGHFGGPWRVKQKICYTCWCITIKFFVDAARRKHVCIHMT